MSTRSQHTQDKLQNNWKINPTSGKRGPKCWKIDPRSVLRAKGCPERLQNAPLQFPSPPKGSQLVRKWVQNGCRSDPSGAENGTTNRKMTQKRSSENRYRKSIETWCQMIVKWSQNGPEIHPRIDAIRERVILWKPCFYYSKSMVFDVAGVENRRKNN